LKRDQRNGSGSTIGAAPRLEPKNGETVVTYGALPPNANELAVLSRSMIEIMNETAADIEVPAADLTDSRTGGRRA
jgi:hypothetical protein